MENQKLDDIVKTLKKSLEKAKSLEYRLQPIPSNVDQEIFKSVDDLRQFDLYGKLPLSDELGVRDTRILQLFSERMAILGVRERNRKRLLLGSLALTLNSFYQEPREALLIMSLHYKCY